MFKQIPFIDSWGPTSLVVLYCRRAKWECEISYVGDRARRINSPLQCRKSLILGLKKLDLIMEDIHGTECSPRCLALSGQYSLTFYYKAEVPKLVYTLSTATSLRPKGDVCTMCVSLSRAYTIHRNPVWVQTTLKDHIYEDRNSAPPKTSRTTPPSQYSSTNVTNATNQNHHTLTWSWESRAECPLTYAVVPYPWISNILTWAMTADGSVRIFHY